MGLEELLFVAALWGAPLGLLWISWHRRRGPHRYGHEQVAGMRLVSLSVPQRGDMAAVLGACANL